MDQAMEESSVLLRKRCAPVNQYYSMLMVDTPGYIPSPNWNKPEKPVDRVNPRSLMHRKPKVGSTVTHIKPPTGLGKTAVYNAPVYNAPVYNAPIHSAPVYNDRSSSASHGGSMNPNPSSLESLERITSAYLDTDKVSERRFGNMQRNLKRGTRGPSLVGDSNGESSNGSGNENEDRDNALYDDRMIESDRKDLVDWLYQIRKIRQNDLPKQFIKQREQDLDNAQADFISSRKIPVYLDGVKPPWNQGTGQAIIRYNEMIIRKLEKRVERARERNAALCTLEDAAKRTDGPSGQGKR
jgi:hypothetical protein